MSFEEQDEVIGSKIHQTGVLLDAVNMNPEMRELSKELKIAHSLFNYIDGSKRENEALVDSVIFRMKDIEKRIAYTVAMNTRKEGLNCENT